MEEIEVPTEHLNEEIQERAEEQKEKWVLGVALSTAFMAVLAAVAGLLAGHHANEAMIARVEASDKWNQYQAKSLKIEIDANAADTFAFGRTAEVLDEAKGEANTWTLVGSTEANLAEGRLSAESPIGRALLNAKVGKPIKIETPKGSRTFVVQKLVG